MGGRLVMGEVYLGKRLEMRRRKATRLCPFVMVRSVCEVDGGREYGKHVLGAVVVGLSTLVINRR